jgi:hypothetical protein
MKRIERKTAPRSTAGPLWPIIFLDLSSGQQSLSTVHDDFGINVERAPVLVAHVHLHTVEVLQARELAGKRLGLRANPMS